MGTEEHQVYSFEAVLHENADDGGAYVIFPWDLREEFGKGRVRVNASFDGISYAGSIVNMGLKNENGTICYLIGVIKAIRKQIGKKDGDTVHVEISLREPAGRENAKQKGRFG